MLDQEYQKLVHYIEGMIADGVALVHGGQLFDWDSTNIPELLQSIKEKQELANSELLETGDLLKNVYSNQKAVVINTNDETVNMALIGNVMVYPKEALWLHFERSQPGV